MSKIQKIIFISCIIYSITLVFHALYVSYIDSTYQVIIADQLAFYNRGKGVLYGLLPYRDIPTNAAPLSPYLWAPLVLISMIITNDYSSDLLKSLNFTDSASMMFSSYIFRTFFVICLIAAAVVLYKLLEMKENKHSFWISLTFAINPFFLYLVSFWGSDESILPLLILLPIYLFEKKKNYLAILVIILGTGLKYMPIFLAPLIWIYSENWKQRIIQSFLLILGILMVYAPFYFISPEDFLRQFDNEIGHMGNQGLITILQASLSFNIDDFSFVFTITTAVLIGISSFLLFLRRKKWSYEYTTISLMLFLIFYPKMQYSYVVLVFPFLFIFIFQRNSLRWFSLLMLITGVAGSGVSTMLIEKTTENLVALSLAWLVILLFYFSMFAIIIALPIQKKLNLG